MAEKKDAVSQDQHRIDILALSRLKILTEDGNELYFSQLWKAGPVVVIFLRHFGCIACRSHVDKIWSKKDELYKKNTKVIFIGSGSPQALKMFKEDLNIPDAPIFTDPTLATFAACGMKNGIRFLASAETVKNAYKLYKEGYTQKNLKDSGFHKQMGGVAAFKNPGKVLYHFVSRSLGDFDDPEDWPEDEGQD